MSETKATFKEWWSDYPCIDYETMIAAGDAWDYQDKRIAELEAKVERMKDALTAISTALDAYGVDYCRGTAKAVLESSDE